MCIILLLLLLLLSVYAENDPLPCARAQTREHNVLVTDSTSKFGWVDAIILIHYVLLYSFSSQNVTKDGIIISVR